MHTRRMYLALGASTLVASTAGCTDSVPLLGAEPLEFSAAPASIPQSVLDETGYDEHEIENIEIEETFAVGDQTQEVIVTNWQAECDKSLDVERLEISVPERPRAAVFTALTTPQVNVLGQAFNPVADMTSEELADMVQDRYDGVDNLEQVTAESVQIAGESTTVGEFEGEAALVGDGVTIDLTLHIAEAVEAGDDLIVGVGGYPTIVKDVERPNIVSLLEGIEYD